MSLISLALVIGCTGLFMLLIGIGLGKLFNTTQKIYKRGLHRPLNLSFTEQTILYLQNPDIFIPITFAFVGVSMVIVSVIIAILGVAEKFLI